MKRITALLMALILMLGAASSGVYAQEPAAVEGIWVEITPAKLQYVANQESLDVSGGVLGVRYTDGSFATIPMTEDMVTGFDNTYVNRLDLTVSYGGCSTWYTVAIVDSVDAPLVMDQSMEIGAGKLLYRVGEPLCIDGATLTLTYNNGTVEVVQITEELVVNFDTSAPGTYYYYIQHPTAIYGCMTYTVYDAENLGGSCGENATWSLSESGELRISGSGTVSNGAWWQYKSMVKALVVEEGITKIYGNMFADYSNLQTATLPDTMTEIQSSLFAGCTALRSVKLPANLKTIWSGAFSGCSALNDIAFPEGLREIYNDAFCGCIALREITFPISLQTLYSQAFADCTGLQTITFLSAVAPYGDFTELFRGVTATVSYPGTAGWRELQRDCGGNLTWVSTRPGAEGLKINYYQKEVYVGGFVELLPVAIPGYLEVDCEVTIEGDALTVGEQYSSYIMLRAEKTGTAKVTLTDKLSGHSASVDITVKAPMPISSPFQEKITFEPGQIYREYVFTPEETGTYVLLTGETEQFGFDEPEIMVWSVSETGEAYLESGIYGAATEQWKPCSFFLEAGKTYRICLELDDNVFGRTQNPVNTVFRLEKKSTAAGIEILGGDRFVYGADGVCLSSEPLYVQSVSGNDVIPINEILWESSAPDVMQVGYDMPSSTYVIATYAEGSAVITARWGEFSDSITVTTKEPEAVQLNAPVQFAENYPQTTVRAFTPGQTGNYTFLAERIAPDDELVLTFGLQGDGSEVFLGSTDDGTQVTQTYTLTGGVTYYVIFFSGPRSDTSPGLTFEVRKEDLKPTELEIICTMLTDTKGFYTVRFFPEGAYDNIVSWQSSDPNILRFYDYGTQYALRGRGEIYGSGQVTITATTESGMKVSRTITLGKCHNGHSFGEWETLRRETCTFYGKEAAACDFCALEKYRKVPAAGHSYSNTCDESCNLCGSMREAAHAYGNAWQKDENAHWQVCATCGKQSDHQEHSLEEVTQSCSVCGDIPAEPEAAHTHREQASWQQDAMGHWHSCTGCDEKLAYADHTMEQNTCTVCGYTAETPLTEESTLPAETLPPSTEEGSGSAWITTALLVVAAAAVVAVPAVLLGIQWFKAKRK